MFTLKKHLNLSVIPAFWLSCGMWIYRLWICLISFKDSPASKPQIQALHVWLPWLNSCTFSVQRHTLREVDQKTIFGISNMRTENLATQGFHFFTKSITALNSLSTKRPLASVPPTEYQNHDRMWTGSVGPCNWFQRACRHGHLARPPSKGTLTVLCAGLIKGVSSDRTRIERTTDWEQSLPNV